MESYENLMEPLLSQAPKWDPALFENGRLEVLRTRFEEGVRIALNVPLWVKKTGREIRHSSFKVFLERDTGLQGGEDYFIRDGVTITGISSLRQRGIRVIVSVTDKPLSELLGDSENPAHTEWQERSPKFRGRYEKGTSCLRFVKNSPREVVKLLLRPAEGTDKNMLRNFFYVDLMKQTGTGKTAEFLKDKPGPGQIDGQHPEDVIHSTGIVPPPHFLLIKRIARGFRLSVNPKAQRIPRFVELEIAYDMRQGNPFSNYSEFDFDLGKEPIAIEASGAKHLTLKSNRIKLTLETRAFSFQVTGFDPNRDLKIKTVTSLDETL